ncbi:MAG: nucleotidyltransferase family protein [Gemmatimonadetes bacterium]|nr:nucleotidyltransferase family protein [Gemmatimonadota bacterium]
MNAQLSISKTELSAYCKNHGIRRLAIFGSVLRPDFGPESDIDVLVEFAPGHTPGLLGMAGLEIELSELFGGRKVDLRTPEELSRYFRQKVIDTAEVLYVQG